MIRAFPDMVLPGLDDAPLTVGDGVILVNPFRNLMPHRRSSLL